MSEKDCEKPENPKSRYLYDCLLVAIALLYFSGNLTWLLSGTGKLYDIEYFKLVILKYFNVPTWLIFTGLVTYDIAMYSSYYHIAGNIDVEFNLTF